MGTHEYDAGQEGNEKPCLLMLDQRQSGEGNHGGEEGKRVHCAHPRLAHPGQDAEIHQPADGTHHKDGR
jgi:hypothetical protein